MGSWLGTAPRSGASLATKSRVNPPVLLFTGAGAGAGELEGEGAGEDAGEDAGAGAGEGAGACTACP